MPPDSGNAAINWQSFLNQIVQGGIDVVKLKHLGVPTADRRVPDQADLYYGNTLSKPAGSVPFWAWIVGGLVVVAGVVFVVRMK